MSIVNQLKFDKDGLIPAIVQDHQTGELLMVAYMNKEAVERSLSDGRAWYWSRSRRQYWLKGESSGHFQHIKGVYVDCDADALLLKVEQVGGACHTGFRSCFFRRVEGDELREVGDKVFDPHEKY
ncbi:MAG: phosphoribosyl-AMP cyclohydrolase [bacterium]|mgnify:FL=1|jgi:phosphoribosyl-AMP cyclohydrolase|nr:phosphoribosyl-AMP cyclohydrolase [bacterium]MDD3805256.1 phosphoribosyl-AMP cyclohydrolase [bacterium]MDD4153411.1 phosphoribosyl-AMP cyclohydrolase [bacterium]MDD4557495.1 phosphoribosyl-AMP cyclohydrolase [bacterium]